MANSFGSRRTDCQLKAVLSALAVILFTGLSSSAIAQVTPAGPDTPVSSDSTNTQTAAPDAGSTPFTGIAPEPGPAAGATDGSVAPGSSGAEKGSQAKTTIASNEQEAKDRLFVDAIFIAVAVILCVLAVFLFMSLPKQSKSAGSDNQ
jgi:cobalamin biosynthesis Mg chelatase CobN